MGRGGTRRLLSAVMVLGALALTQLPASAVDALAAPGSVAAVTTPTTVLVTWTDTNTRESGYSVERSASASGPWAVAGTTTRNQESFSDPARSAFYRVRARGKQQAYSPYSPVVAAGGATDTTAPTPSPVVTFSGLTCNTVTVNWTASSDPESGIARYEFERGGFQVIVVDAPGSRIVGGLAPSTRYAFTLSAINRAGLRAATTNAVTTPPCPPPPPPGNPGDVLSRAARGGTGYEVGRAVVVDGARNVIMTGSFAGSANFGTGTLDSGSASNNDVFLAKYDVGGTPMWAKRFGGPGSDLGTAVTVDRSPNCDGQGGTNCIVITGSFQNTANFGGNSLTSAGSDDIFLAKYSSSGAHLWSKGFGVNGNFVDIGEGVAFDANGNVFLTGLYTFQGNFGGAQLISPYYDGDAFVAKFSPSGAHIWSRNFPSTSRDWSNAIAVDANGDVAITGMFFGAMDFGFGYMRAGAEDIFVAKLAGNDGHALWAKRFGGGDADRGLGIGFDRSGNVLATGSLYNGTADFGGGPMVTGYQQVAFLVKLTGDTGAHMWSKRLGNVADPAKGSFNTGAFSVAVDANDDVAVTGNFMGTVDFGGGPVSVTGTNPYSYDIFVAQYTKDGAYRWVDRFGSTSTEFNGYGLTVDSATNDVIATGSFGGTVNFAGANLTSAGSDDAYLIRMRS
jgi:hypothetical protein